MVLMLLIALRGLYPARACISPARHFDVFGKLMLASSLALGYGYVMDAFTTFYGPDEADKTMFTERVFGIYWLGLLGHDPVQHHHPATALVPAHPPEPDRRWC